MILIKILLLSWLITSFVPLQKVIYSFKPFAGLNFVTKLLFDVIVLLTSCLKCCSLWVGLIISHSIWIAIVASFIGYVYTNRIQPKIEKITLQ